MAVQANTDHPVVAQVGMVDAPSSVGESGPARPAMNADAAREYKRALDAFAAGELQNARQGFAKAGEKDDRAYQAFYSLGVVQERLKDAGAASSYRRAFTIVPDYEPAILGYATLLLRRGSAGEAESFLNEKRGQMPKSAAVLAALAEVKSVQRDSGAAQQLSQEALKLNPDYRPAMVTLARDHYRNRRLDLALYALQAILDGFEPVAENPPRDRDNAEAHLLRGLIWRELGNRAGAIEEFRRAVQRRPDLVEARVQVATMLLEAGNAQEALVMLDGAVRYDAELVPARLALGDAYRLLGRYDSAKQEFEWVKSREPNQAETYYDLALLYLFAPKVGALSAKEQVQQATVNLKRYQELRAKGTQDDSDELLNRAKLKEGEIDAAAQAAQAPPEAAAPAGQQPPAAGEAQPATETPKE